MIFPAGIKPGAAGPSTPPRCEAAAFRLYCVGALPLQQHTRLTRRELVSGLALVPAFGSGTNARAESKAAMGHVVLLGDSVFDNAAYVGGGPDVVRQVRERLPRGWDASLRAVDGSMVAGLPSSSRAFHPTRPTSS